MTTHVSDTRPPAPQPPAPPAASTAKRALWKTIVAAVLIFLVGVGIGSAGSGDDATKLAAAQHKVAAVKAQETTLSEKLNQARSDNADTAAKLDQAEKRAEGAVAAARVEVKKQFADKTAALKRRVSRLNARSADLDRREKKVTGMEHAWAANTIPGDGMFLVGTDIAPGVYKANASEGCYWSRLSSLNTSDIIDNNNENGPVVLQVAPSDKALELSGCADFHKVG